MMMNKAIFIILTTIFAGVLAQKDPCRRYHLINMHEGRRQSNYSTQTSDYPICDYVFIRTGWWYKFLDNGINYKIPEYCLDLYQCGTLAPIWMNGNHPTNFNTIEHNTLCGSYANNCCGWSSTVNVTRCRSGHGGDFYVYQLSEPVGCPLGFCATPSEEHEHKGDMIGCDINNECTQVMVDLSKRLTGWIYTTNFTCVYTNVNNRQETTLDVTFRTATTVQCPVPTNQTWEEPRLFNLTVQYRDIREHELQILRPTVQVSLYNSSSHSCNGQGICTKKSTGVFVRPTTLSVTSQTVTDGSESSDTVLPSSSTVLTILSSQIKQIPDTANLTGGNPRSYRDQTTVSETENDSKSPEISETQHYLAPTSTMDLPDESSYPDSKTVISPTTAHDDKSPPGPTIEATIPAEDSFTKYLEYKATKSIQQPDISSGTNVLWSSPTNAYSTDAYIYPSTSHEKHTQI